MSSKLLNGFSVPETCQVDDRYLARLNPHTRDTLIAFDEGPHVYYVAGQTGYTSVTTVIHQFFEPFDGPLIAGYISKSPNFPHAEKFKQYAHIQKNSETVIEDIQEVWRSQAALGTKLHAYIESYFNDFAKAKHGEEKFEVSLTSTEKEAAEYSYFFRYAKCVEIAGWIPFRTEWMIYDCDSKITGSIDMVFVDTATGKYHMRDWKRSKSIRTSSSTKGNGPCSALPDCNYYHYSLQLNLYKYILEKNYGIEIESMALVVFHPDNRDFLTFEVQEFPFQKIVGEIVVEKKKKIN